MTHAKMTRMLAAVLAVSALAACDSNGDKLTGSLAVPEAREARVTLTPALDVTGLVDSNLASRLVIEEITVNVSELRLRHTTVDIQPPAQGRLNTSLTCLHRDVVRVYACDA